MVQRIVLELQRRGYLVWFDRKLCSAAFVQSYTQADLCVSCTVERMKGSVIEAMSEAIEGAEVMLFGYVPRRFFCALVPRFLRLPFFF